MPVVDLPQGLSIGITPKQLWAASVAEKLRPRITAYVGSIRSGKTIGAMYPFLTHVHRCGPHGDIVMVGKTLDTLERNVLAPMQQMLGKDTFTYRSGARSAMLDGREIVLLSANDRSSYKRLRGLTCAGWYGDEVTLWPQNFFDELLGRMLGRLQVKPRGFFTTNPDHPNHWLKGWLNRIETDALDWLHFRFRLADNDFLRDEDIEAVRREYEGLWYQRLILGMWVIASGAVYSMYDPDVHIVAPPTPFQHYAVGVDVGSTSPTAFVLLGWDDPADGIYVVDVYYHDPSADGSHVKTNAELASDFDDWLLRQQVRVDDVVVDPAARDFREELRQRGYDPTPGNNDVLEGIRFTSSLLAHKGSREPTLFFAPGSSTQAMRDELQSYVWQEQDGVRHDTPIKENDHTLDALRYPLYTLLRDELRGRSSPQPHSTVVQSGA